MSRHLSVQIEDWDRACLELVAFFPEHWRDLGYHHEALPLAPDWQTLQRLNAMDKLLLVTLRDGGELAGWMLTIVTPELHHSTSMGAMADNFYVRPEYRGRMGGRRLMRRTEEELRRRGVVRWLVGLSHRSDAGRLLAAFGFAPVQTTYAKVLQP